MTRDRRGLLTLQLVKDLIAEEEQSVDYTRIREKLALEEPVLDSNLKHWIQRESQRLVDRFPGTKDEEVVYIAHLLERYFLRGWRAMRKAVSAEWDKMFEQPSEGK